MQKLKLEFWHKFFIFGNLLHTLGINTLGLKMIIEGMYNMENLVWEDSFLRQYAKRRGMIR